MAQQPGTVNKEAHASPMNRSVSRDALTRAASTSPVLGEETGGSFLGRVVIELWAPADQTLSDGLRYLVVPTTTLAADELLHRVRETLAKRP